METRYDSELSTSSGKDTTDEFRCSAFPDRPQDIIFDSESLPTLALLFR